MNRPARAALAPGLEISRIVTGLWQVADQERDGAPLDPEPASRAMARYADAGLTTFDMADHYGSAELLAGSFANGRRDVQLLTKWVPEPGPASEKAVEEAVDRALERLRTDAIDLLQFHAWNYADPSWLDCLFMLAEHQAAGRIRHLGLTNCDAVHLDMAIRSGVPIVANQVCYSLLDRRPEDAMTEACRTHGVKLLAYGTLAGGFLTERWLGRAEPPIDDSLTWSQMKYRRFIDVAGGWERLQHLLEVAARVARRLNVSVANVACRYVLEHRAVAGIAIGARLGENSHVEENLRVFDFSLDESALADLSAACAEMEPIPGDCGDEYRRPPFLTASGDLRHHVTQIPAPYPVRSEGRVQRVSTGTPWERLAGYSRAIRRGNRIWVAGTTASHGARLIGGRDPAAQTHFIVDKIECALQSLGARLQDVVRTRVFIGDGVDWAAVARAHGARFANVLPANTLVRANTVDDHLLVEIEAEAVVA